ncbi:hypothetical protein DPMN_043885 [Dreissena polymorpha]|uniref:Concentrative nucleoside transporter N-terminal domain-containing protein n=1 Tax=Dreissena polymorpha TaxID=45954 RepID=A0A9D4HYE4_DREPO|nr:hypothetical protein DPMN_043885 [Dreissena polymorpha]
MKKLHGVFLYTKYLRPCSHVLRPYRGLLKLLITVAVTCSVLLFIAIDTCTRRPASLVSLLGILVFTLAMFFFSTDPRQVTWRPVLWGLLLQLVFGLLVLRTHWGCLAFQWLGARVSDYLAYTHVGTQFVFGPGITDIFAFSVSCFSRYVPIHLSSIVSEA